MGMNLKSLCIGLEIVHTSLTDNSVRADSRCLLGNRVTSSHHSNHCDEGSYDHDLILHADLVFSQE